MQFLAIVALSILSAILYGIVHDQITARICVEYFTIGHPPAFDTDDPTLLGLGWGTLATWWVGLLLGIPLALVARVGPLPRRSAVSLVKPIARMMLLTGACAIVAGVLGWVLARNGVVYLVGDMAYLVPEDKHVAFLVCRCAHSASYLIGFLCGLFLIVRVGWQRFRASGSA